MIVAMTPGDAAVMNGSANPLRSEEHTSELQSQSNLVCRLLLEKKKTTSILQHFEPRQQGSPQRSGRSFNLRTYTLTVPLFRSSTCAPSCPSHVVSDHAEYPAVHT